MDTLNEEKDDFLSVTAALKKDKKDEEPALQPEEYADYLKLRLLMVESSRDDPLTEARMILRLKKSYSNLNVEMPEGVKKYLIKEVKRTALIIAQRIKEKRALLEEEKRKREELMAKAKESKEEEKIPRSRAIWMDN